MEKQTIGVGVVMLSVGIVIGYILPFLDRGYHDDDYMMADGMPSGQHRMSDGSMMNHESMMGAERMSPMDHMMAMSVESEREFIEGMIPHHQEAVDTAKEVIARGGTTPEIKVLVENIVIAQEREIAEMKAWYEAWYGESYRDTGVYVPMMRELESLTGAELDRVFLEDMIMHHMGAIMMAQSVQPHIEHDEVARLTEAIVATQSREIAEMRMMLKALK